MNFGEIEEEIFCEVAGLSEIPAGAYNFRVNGKSVSRKSSENIDVSSRKDGNGLEIKIKPGTKNEQIHIPVAISATGIKEVVYNDFYIGEGADVVIVAGCGIYNCGPIDSVHDGVHRFYVGKGAKIRYVEKHYGFGQGRGGKILNPVTEVYLEEGAEAFYVNNDNAETVMITNTFSIDGSKRDGEFTMDSSGGKLSVEYDIDLSKKSVFGIPYGVYTPDFRNIVPGASLELEVTEGKNGSTEHILTVGGLKNLTDDMLSAVDITVNTTNKSSAKEPSGKKEDISDYDMEELMALLEDIGYGVSDALMDSPEIEELMESLYGY